MPKIMKLKEVNITFSIWLVKKDWTLLWSSIRCNKSPITLLSKNDMGNFSNFIKKSLISDILTLIDIWSNSHLRIKSVAVRPQTIISSPKRINQIKLISLRLMPISTIDWVMNGMMSCNIQPNIRPAIIWSKCFLYGSI